MRWKGIPGFENRYLISDEGDIHTLCTGKISKGYLYPNGYYIIEFYNKGKKIKIYMHILVAKLFVPGEKEGLIVDHKDDVKVNNFAINLQWITQGDNVRKSMHKIKRYKKRVNQYNLKGDFIKTYESATAACIALSRNKRSPMIAYACKGKCSTNNCNTAYGYIWKYID